MNLNEKFKNIERTMSHKLPATRWSMARIDGRAFHTYTRGLDAPYDEKFVAAMNATLLALCNMEVPVAMGYVQSDEISLLIDNRSLNGTLNPWYGGKMQKIISVLSSAATAYFNMERAKQGYSTPAFFDARVIPIKSVDEIGMYFAWRHADAVKNTISMAAHAAFSEKDVDSKTSEERKTMLAEIGKPWEGLPVGFRHGRYAVRESFPETISFVHGKTKQTETKEILSKRWVLTDADEYPGMEAFLPAHDVPRYQKGVELGIDVDSLNEYDVSTARIMANVLKESTKVPFSLDSFTHHLPKLTEEQEKLSQLSREDFEFLTGADLRKSKKTSK